MTASNGDQCISRNSADSLPERPEAVEALADESAWLFDSQRSYLDQLASYRRYRPAFVRASRAGETRPSRAGKKERNGWRARKRERQLLNGSGPVE